MDYESQLLQQQKISDLACKTQPPTLTRLGLLSWLTAKLQVDLSSLSEITLQYMDDSLARDIFFAAEHAQTHLGDTSYWEGCISIRDRDAVPLPIKEVLSSMILSLFSIANALISIQGKNYNVVDYAHRLAMEEDNPGRHVSSLHQPSMTRSEFIKMCDLGSDPDDVLQIIARKLECEIP